MDQSVASRRLIAQYGRLKRLEGETPQSRGRQFNELICDMLEASGLDPRANVRGVGEADVLCKIGDTRFVIEAKWESVKSDTGHIAKLQKRVRQRPTGTLGLMLAMAGYTQEAVDDLDRGDRIEVFLLDRSHWEAMLSGLVPPLELIELVSDHTAATGRPYSSLPDLLMPHRAFRMPPQTLPPDTFTAAGGASVSSVVTDIESDQLGIAATEGRLLLTTADGIANVDASTGELRDIARISACHGNVVAKSTDAFLFTRRRGAAIWDRGTIRVLSGGYAGATAVLDFQGSASVFDNGGADGQPLISRLGAGLGDQVDIPIDIPSGQAGAACWLSPNALLTAGNGPIKIFNLMTGTSRDLSAPAPNLFAICRFEDGRLWVCGDSPPGLAIYQLAVVTGQVDSVTAVPLMGSVKALAADPRSDIGYVAAYQADTTPVRYSVLRVEPSTSEQDRDEHGSGCARST